MLDEKVIKDLINLVKLNMITTEEIADLEYKKEVENRLGQTNA